MKRFLITLIALQLVVAMGCANTSSRQYSKEMLAAKARSEKVIKELDTSAAPVLGPVYKEFLEALLEDDIEKAWGMVSRAGQQYFTTLPEKHREYNPGMMDKLEDDKKRLHAMKEANAPEDAIIFLEYDIAMNEALLKANSGQDVLRAFAFKFQRLCLNGMEVAGEQIEGNKGRLTIRTQDPRDRDKNRLDFIKENGVWKLAK